MCLLDTDDAAAASIEMLVCSTEWLAHAIDRGLRITDMCPVRSVLRFPQGVLSVAAWMSVCLCSAISVLYRLPMMANLRRSKYFVFCPHIIFVIIPSFKRLLLNCFDCLILLVMLTSLSQQPFCPNDYPSPPQVVITFTPASPELRARLSAAEDAALFDVPCVFFLSFFILFRLFSLNDYVGSESDCR